MNKKIWYLVFSLSTCLILLVCQPVLAGTGQENDNCTKNDDCIPGLTCQSGEGDYQGKNVCMPGYELQGGAHVESPSPSGKVKWQPVVPKLQINIPTWTPFTDTAVEDLKKTEKTSEGEFVYIPFIGLYLSALYRWALLVAGTVCLILILMGAFIYMTAGGNAQRVEEGRARITHALLGLALLLGSYTILYLINPELVKFKSLKIKITQHLEMQPLNEPSENVTSGIAASMECFVTEFGNSKESIKSQLVPITILGKTYQVHKKALDAFKKVANLTDSQPYKITDPGSGTFNWRTNVNNPSLMSLHSFGIALDINPNRNPNYEKTGGTTCKTDIPSDVIKAFKDNGFRWGGDFKKHCDAMHFEWLGHCVKGWTPSTQPNLPGSTSPTEGCCLNGEFNNLGEMTKDECEALNPTNIWDSNGCK